MCGRGDSRGEANPGALDGLAIAPVGPDTAEALALVAELDAELLRRYPGHPLYGLTADDVEDVRTVFLVARVGPEAVACGALRQTDANAGEVKRMYVRPAYRGRGIAREVLAALEAEARRRGLVTVRLETGARQPEAVGLYVSAGYQPCPPFGDYLVSDLSRFFAKDLP